MISYWQYWQTSWQNADGDQSDALEVLGAAPKNHLVSDQLSDLIQLTLNDVTAAFRGVGGTKSENQPQSQNVWSIRDLELLCW